MSESFASNDQGLEATEQLALAVDGLGKLYKLFQHPSDKILHVLGIDRWCPGMRRRKYREFWALRDFSLQIRRGERLGIIGANGAGKSTLLKIITGSISPTEGCVTVNGSVQALLQLGTGFHPEFSGRENIRSYLNYHGLSASQSEDKEREIIGFAELHEFIEQPVKTYSAGMYARLAFSAATAITPDILVIDEVLGAGDAYFAGKCVERMRNLTREDNATVLLVSHDTSAILRICTKVIWMNRGDIILAGEPHMVVQSYIEHVQRETEIRLRAREMALTKRRAQELFPAGGAYTRLLFRFISNDKQPKGRCAFAKASIRDQKGAIAELRIGAAMDNAPNEPNYVIDDATNTNWSAPASVDGRWIRFFKDRGGVDGHAPFILSVPAHLWERDEKFWLVIEHGPTGDEEITLEIWDGDRYQPLGVLPPVAKDFTQTTLAIVRENDVPNTSQADMAHTNDAVPVHANAIPERDESAVRIAGVDFVTNERESTRVIPLGSKVDVVIRVEVLRPVIDPVFAVTFHTLDGTQMDHKNSQLLGSNVGEISGAATATFSFTPFRLGPGDYLVTVAVLKYLDPENWFDTPPAYDRHDRRYCISVNNIELHGKNLGIVLQDSEFTISLDGDPPTPGQRNAAVTC